MDKNTDNPIFFDHGALTAFDDGKNQLLPPTSSSVQGEFQQEVSVILFHVKTRNQYNFPRIYFPFKDVFFLFVLLHLNFR